MIYETEAAMCNDLVGHLERQGWDTFHEIQYEGHTLDIMAKRGQKTWAIEAKLRPTMSVIAQALTWRGKTHSTYVAIGVEPPEQFLAICGSLDIGVIYVQPDGITFLASPYAARPYEGPIVAREQDQYGTPGAQHGRAGAEVPDKLRAFLSDNPGVGVDAAIQIAWGPLSLNWRSRVGWRRRLEGLHGVEVKGRGKNARVWLSEGQEDDRTDEGTAS